ncbi:MULTISPECIES: HAMP domain-containing sensor histidine kinase [unclassified Frankia]|uniref:sensor histidine kinase n=1 Tax=unclassified Frankia TaxID=2632575 RepID=UPI001EF5CD2C|nr:MULTISPECIES: HAMP domain-containing sensor histidine kinase [unclassified Frankia]
MTRLSVRTRLALLIGCLGLVVGGVTLLVAYLAVDHAIARQPIDIPAAVETMPSPEEAPQFKAQLLATGQDIRERLRAQTLGPLVDHGLVLAAGLAAASLAAGWFVGGVTLRPLRQITATARRIADRSLHERVALTGARDEWWELGSAINAMLSRLDAAFAAQRQFVGNASHELKTPLAINQTLLEVAMGRSDAPPELIRLGEIMLEVNARHERLVDGLLALARAEHGITDPRPVDLAEVVGGVLTLLRPDADRLRLRVTAEASPVVVDGDRVLLDRLVQNLLQNAIRHNVASGWLRLAAGPVDGDARLTVVNSGPVIAPANVPELFEPFQRAANRVHSARGTGLGLSIVRSVAQAHGGTVNAVARNEGGLEVVVTIPRSRQQSDSNDQMDLITDQL